MTPTGGGGSGGGGGGGGFCPVGAVDNNIRLSIASITGRFGHASRRCLNCLLMATPVSLTSRLRRDPREPCRADWRNAKRRRGTQPAKKAADAPSLTLSRDRRRIRSLPPEQGSIRATSRMGALIEGG